MIPTSELIVRYQKRHNFTNCLYNLDNILYGAVLTEQAIMAVD